MPNDNAITSSRCFSQLTERPPQAETACAAAGAAKKPIVIIAGKQQPHMQLATRFASGGSFR
ncbi:hypothetical protein [Parageobacillus thermoglucosidasius]|uniref:hypothetical protein n=1 Tax=Parageobacillus thermoglucosidasius TaxID=1426 RepID=UPI000F61D5CD|nr:hypothetical protein [Parageobacillus thermoglucosidasius]